MNNLNRDVNQILFDTLGLPEKYNYFLYCKINNLLDEFNFVEKYFNSLYELPKQEWTNLLIEYTNLQEELLEKYIEEIDWYIVSIYQNLTEDFMEKWATYINWDTISMNRKLTDDFIIRNCDLLNWSYLSNSENLNENIVYQFEDRIDWDLLVVSNYSIDFINKYKHKINWSETFFNDMSRYKLFEDYVDWKKVSYYHQLTEDFMRQYKNKLDWNFISSYQVLSPEFIEEFKNKLNMESVNRFMRRAYTPPILDNITQPPLIRQRRYRRLRRRRGIRIQRHIPIEDF